MDTGDRTSYVDLVPERVASAPDSPGRVPARSNRRAPRSGSTTPTSAGRGRQGGPGSEPALVAGRYKLAYVGTNGQVYVRSSNTRPVQITFGADNPTRLTWSPDGTRSPTHRQGRGVRRHRPGRRAEPGDHLPAQPGCPTFLRAPGRHR